MTQARTIVRLLLGSALAVGLSASALAQPGPPPGAMPAGGMPPGAMPPGARPSGGMPPGFPGGPQMPDSPGPFSAQDLSGVWMLGFAEYVDHKTVKMPLTPKYQKMMEERVAAAQQGEPFADSVSSCQAFGMPRVMTFGMAEILQTPGRLTVLTEVLHEVRRIYLDGRKPPADLDPTYEGYSTGHWEGDALVVDTVGIVANTIDQYGVPMSDKLTVHERIRRVSPNRIQNEITLNDPEALTQPFTVTKTYNKLPPSAEIPEYICTSNNRNAPDKNGRTTAR